MPRATDQIAQHSPESLEADAELQTAVLAYAHAQTSKNRRALSNATYRLQETTPWPKTEKMAPSHRRMLDLMPEHLRWPDPIWGDTLFD